MSYYDIHVNERGEITRTPYAPSDEPSPPVDWFSAVFGVLVVHLQAPVGLLHSFLHEHTKTPPCDEFRFQGRLGFGGKYRRRTNTVDCYPEDETPGRLALIAEANAALAALNPK